MKIILLTSEWNSDVSLDDQGSKTCILVNEQKVVSKEVTMQSSDPFTTKFQTKNIMMRSSGKKTITLSTE